MSLIAAGRLGNNANKFSPPPSEGGKRQERRSLRWARRTALWGLSNVVRCQKCGRTRRGEKVAVKGSEGGSERVGFGGVVTCGSVWVCPVCNAKIMHRRGSEISAGIASHMATDNGRVLFVTLTLRHEKADRLAPQWDMLQKAWHITTKGRVWTKWRQRLGSPGFIRAVEVTDGQNGWHSHLHVLVFVEQQDGYELVDDFRDWLAAKWSRSVRSLGGDALDSVQDLRMLKGAGDEALGGYLTKAQDSLGLELTHSQGKSERDRLGTHPHWHLLSKIIEDGDGDALARWHEWEDASHGRRQISWSRGLRDHLGLNVEQTDEEIAEEVAGDCTLVWIPGDEWDALASSRAWLLPKILDRAEKGTVALVRFLEDHGIGYDTEEV